MNTEITSAQAWLANNGLCYFFFFLLLSVSGMGMEVCVVTSIDESMAGRDLNNNVYAEEKINSQGENTNQGKWLASNKINSKGEEKKRRRRIKIK